MSIPDRSSDPNATIPLGITGPRSPRDERSALFDAQAALNMALDVPGSWAGTPPPNIPPRNIGFPRPGSPSLPSGAVSRGTPSSNQMPAFFDLPGSVADGNRVFATPQDLEEIPDEDKARILRRHLVSRDERDNTSSRRTSVSALPRVDTLRSEPGGSGEPVEEEAEFPIPYSTPGGDITYVSCPHI